MSGDPLVWQELVRKGRLHQVASIGEDIVGHIWRSPDSEEWTASILGERGDSHLHVIASIFPDPATARDCVERGLRLVGILPPRTADVE